MSTSTNISTNPHRADRAQRLTSQLLPAREVDHAFARRLYALFAACYDNVTWPRFLADLAKKDFVVVLRDTESGEPRGFSTQQVLRLQLDGRPVRALFSGDTIIHPDYWGEQELVRGWSRLAGQLLAAEPNVPLYWLLISKGFRTYLYLPVFYHEFWPRYDRPTPPEMQRLLDTLAHKMWPGHYCPESGLVDFGRSLGNLKEDVADIPAGRLDDPHVQYFTQRNPTYARGTELVCLAPVSLSNTKSVGRRLIQRAIADANALSRAREEEASCA